MEQLIEKKQVTIKKVKTNIWTDRQPMQAFTECKDSLCVPMLANGTYPDPLKGFSDEQRRELEERIGLPEGTLKAKSPYWHTYTVFIPAAGLKLDLELAEDVINYYVIKTNESKVADGNIEFAKKNNSSTDVLYLITDEESEAKRNISLREIKMKASAKFYEMTSENKRDMLVFLGMQTGGMSAAIIEDKLGAIVDSNAGARQFLAALDNPLFKNTVDIKDMINVGLLEQRGPNILLNGETIGIDLESAIKYFKVGKNNSTWISLKAKLNESKE